MSVLHAKLLRDAGLTVAADDFDREVIYDTPECPSCGEGCGGHGVFAFHDKGCGGVIHPDAKDDRCRCFDWPLALARDIAGEQAS